MATVLKGFVPLILLIFQGAITKRMTAIEEMARMDVLCSVKTAALTLNRLTVDRNLIDVCELTAAHCIIILKRA